MKDADRLAIRDAPGGAVLAVKAVPGSSRDRVVGVLGDCLKLAVAAPAEKGKANAAIASLLAAQLGLPARSIELVSGAASPRKAFLVRGLSAQQLRARL